MTTSKWGESILKSSLPSKEKLESSRVHYPHQYAPPPP